MAIDQLKLLCDKASGHGIHPVTVRYLLRTHAPTLYAAMSFEEIVPKPERRGRGVGPVPQPGFRAPHWQTRWSKDCLLCGGPLLAGDRLDRVALGDSGARFPHALCARAKRAAAAQKRYHDADAARRRRAGRTRKSSAR